MYMCYMVDWLALPPPYDVVIPRWLEYIGAMLYNLVHDCIVHVWCMHAYTCRNGDIIN